MSPFSRKPGMRRWARTLFHLDACQSAECKVADPGTFSFQPQQQHQLWDVVLPIPKCITLTLKITTIILFCCTNGWFSLICFISVIHFETLSDKFWLSFFFEDSWKKLKLQIFARITSIHPHLALDDLCYGGKPQKSLRSSGRFTGKTCLQFTKSKTPTKAFNVVLQIWVMNIVKCGTYM